jgi:hypothetical protein
MHRVQILKWLKFPHTINTVGLSIHNLKLHRVGYITVAEIAVIHINTVH